MIPKFRAMIETRKGKVLIYSKNYDVTFYQNYVQFWQGLTKHKISYESLMQSTGLTDKNGKEIFEGDIVKLRYTVTSDEELFVVRRFRGGSWRIDNRRRGCELWLRNENCEVVGNIHENLELVEEINEQNF